MASYVICKSDNNRKLESKILLKDGYKFRGKVSITMYESELTKAVLIKKVNDSLKNIMIALLELDSDDEDGTKQSELEIRIETLRILLLEKYFPFIGKTRANAYLTKLDEMINKIPRKENKKSRIR